MKKHTEAKTEVSQFVTSTVSQIVDYVKSQYGLTEFNVDTSIIKGERSWGGIRSGIPFIDISITRYISAVEANSKIDFEEYPSFAWNKEIGSLQTVHWKKALTALIAHEIAHSVQYYNPLKAVDVLFASRSDVTPTELRGHKKLWRHIYKDFRVQFVNGKSFEDSSEVQNEIEPVVKPASSVKPTTPVTKPVTKPVGKKNWTVVKTKKANGLQIEYIEQSTGKVVLTLLEPKGTKLIRVLDTKTNKWIETNTTDRIEVRKQYLVD